MRDDLAGPAPAALSSWRYRNVPWIPGQSPRSRRPVIKVADHSPNASKGRSMEYRTLGRTAIEDGDAPLDDERHTRL
jgi:hypothetical protein